MKIKYLGGEDPVTYYCLEIKDREGNTTGRLNYISSENVVKDIAKIVGFTLPDTSSYIDLERGDICLLYTSPSPRDYAASRMPSSA